MKKIFFILLLAGLYAQTNHYHVDCTNGLNTNPGTLAAPFSNIQYAINQVSTNDTANGHVYIWVHSGHYVSNVNVSNVNSAPDSNLIITAWTNTDNTPQTVILTNESATNWTLCIWTNHISISNIEFLNNRTGPGLQGIRIQNGSNVTLEKLKISGFTNGVFFFRGSYCIVKNCTIFSNVNAGIYMGVGAGQSTNLFFSNDFYATNMAYGVYFDSGTGRGNLVISNLFRWCATGISYRMGDGYIGSNLFLSNRTTGITISYGNKGVIEYNRFDGNNIMSTAQGISLTVNSSSNLFISNTICSNPSGGMIINGGTNNFIINNIFFSNNVFNVRSYNSTAISNYFMSNTFTGNHTMAHFKIDSGSLGHNFVSNSFFDNTSPAVQMYNGSTFNIFSNNLFWSNHGGIYLEGANSDDNNIISNIFKENMRGGGSSYGILIDSNAYCNSIFFNTFISNNRAVMLTNNAASNVILSNIISYNSNSGIMVFTGCTSNEFRYNTVFNSSNGIRFYVGNLNNLTIGNTLCSNTYCGIRTTTNTNSRFILNNIFSNEVGIFVFYGCSNRTMSNRIHRNLNGIVKSNDIDSIVYNNKIYLNYQRGIEEINATNCRIVNNVIFSNGWCGIYWTNCSGYALNNIILSNSSNDTYKGICQIGGLITNDFNIIYGISTRLTNGSNFGLNNVYLPPYVDLTMPYIEGTTFKIQSKYSPCVDSGTNFFGYPFSNLAPDIGIDESDYMQYFRKIGKCLANTNTVSPTLIKVWLY